MLATSQKINLREERDFGDKLNATFQFIKQNIKPLLRVLLLFVTPVAVLAGILSGLAQSKLLRTLNSEGGYHATWADFYFANNLVVVNQVASMFFQVVSYVMVGLAVYGFMKVYMEEEKVTPAAVWENIKPNLVRGIYASVALSIVGIVGLLFLVIPGMYFFIVISLFLPIMVHEETGFTESVERCFYLIKSNWWSTFGLVLVAGFIQAMLTWLTAFPAVGIQLLQQFQVIGPDNQLLTLFSTSLIEIMGIFMHTVSAVAIGFQYFNLVEKKEGLGLLAQADQIGRDTDANAAANEGEY